MDVLKKNTSPTFEIVPRKVLDVSNVFKIKLINEFTKVAQDILATSVSLLANENYQITLASFPTGKIGEKLSYKIVDNISNEVLSLGKILIVSQTENIQDYSKKLNSKFYN